jgi:hypothetical protein
LQTPFTPVGVFWISHSGTLSSLHPPPFTTEFAEYKKKIPSFGAVLVNSALTKVRIIERNP